MLVFTEGLSELFTNTLIATSVNDRWFQALRFCKLVLYDLILALGMHLVNNGFQVTN